MEELRLALDDLADIQRMLEAREEEHATYWREIGFQRNSDKARCVMGKASKVHEDLLVRPLTAAEEEARRVAAEGGGEVETRPDRTFVKRASRQAEPREVGRPPENTWD